MPGSIWKLFSLFKVIQPSPVRLSSVSPYYHMFLWKGNLIASICWCLGGASLPPSCTNTSRIWKFQILMSQLKPMCQLCMVLRQKCSRHSPSTLLDPSCPESHTCTMGQQHLPQQQKRIDQNADASEHTGRGLTGNNDDGNCQSMVRPVDFHELKSVSWLSISNEGAEFSYSSLWDISVLWDVNSCPTQKESYDKIALVLQLFFPVGLLRTLTVTIRGRKIFLKS